MKIVASFENGQRVKVERYEQNQKVGTRQLYINDYIGSLMSELPIANVINHIIERDEEYKEYLKSTVESQEFSAFLVQTMKYASRHNLIKNVEYHEFLKYAFSKINVLDTFGPDVESIFTALFYQVKELPNEPVYLELLDELLKRVISNDTKQEVLARVFPTIIKISRELDLPHLREWFNLVIPHIEPLWLYEALGRLKDAPEMVLGEIELPKNCVVTKITNKRTIYVLEIPKSRFRVKFHDVAYEEVGHPRMACILEVKVNRVTEMKLVAVPDKGEISLNTPVHRYPYSNVFEDGRVCWDGYKGQEINSEKDLAALPLLFLSGTNNTHLRANVRELFEHYRGKDYKTEQLVPFGMTLKQMMN